MTESRPESDFSSVSGSLEDRLCGALAKLSLAARHDYRRESAERGLSAVQAQILSLLVREPLLGMGELAARLALTPATVSDSVKALERRGLVRRQPVSGDRRRVRVAVTRQGRRTGAALALWPELFRDGIAHLSPAEKQTLFRAMVRLILVLLAKGTIQKARMCVTCAYFEPNIRPGARRPHRCALAEVPLGNDALRLECAEHEEGRNAEDVLAQLDRWLGAAS